MRKPVYVVFDQVRHKPGCTAKEDGFRLEISDLRSRRIVLSMCSENKGADQLCGNRFSHDAAHFYKYRFTFIYYSEYFFAAS